MKKTTLLLSLAFSLLLWSCGQKSDDGKEESTEPANEEVTVNEEETAEAEEAEEVEITTELYCDIYKELNALKMEEYWPKFKGKEYEEVKGLYEKYLEEEQAILDKYGVESFSDLSSYFRENFAEIEEHNANDPDYINYPEKTDAKFKIAEFAGARADEKTDELIDQVK